MARMTAMPVGQVPVSLSVAERVVAWPGQIGRFPVTCR
jgi:hypothetical protein